VSDCEIPEFYICHEPVAKKAHDCVECSAKIVPGEKYLRVNLKYDGTVTAYKQHLQCAEACEYFRDHIGDECLYYGELKEWWGQDGHFMSKKEPHGPEMRRLMARVIWREHRERRRGGKQ
jgi:hypothetical protein